jgi:hypothetical protein
MSQIGPIAAELRRGASNARVPRSALPLYLIVRLSGTQHAAAHYQLAIDLQARQMDIIGEFQNHADECQRMARFTRDLASKVMWNRMAERWQSLVATEKARTRQRSEPGIRRAPPVHRRVDRWHAA